MKTAILLVSIIYPATCVAMLESHYDPSQNHIKTSDKYFKQGEHEVENLKLSETLEAKTAETLPKLTPLNSLQKKYLNDVIQAASNVIENKIVLREEEHFFGQGEFFYDKNPNRPEEVLITYRDLKFSRIKLQFERETKNSPWKKATIFVAPRNFPKGMYKIDFSLPALQGLTYENSSKQITPDQSIKKINLFRYFLMSNKKISYVFSASADFAELDEKSPTHFFSLEISDEANRLQ